MTEYLFITTGDFITMNDKDLKDKHLTIDDAILASSRILMEVVAKRDDQSYYTQFWTPEQGYV